MSQGSRHPITGVGRRRNQMMSAMHWAGTEQGEAKLKAGAQWLVLPIGRRRVARTKSEVLSIIELSVQSLPAKPKCFQLLKCVKRV